MESVRKRKINKIKDKEKSDEYSSLFLEVNFGVHNTIKQRCRQVLLKTAIDCTEDEGGTITVTISDAE